MGNCTVSATYSVGLRSGRSGVRPGVGSTGALPSLWSSEGVSTVLVPVSVESPVAALDRAESTGDSSEHPGSRRQATSEAWERRMAMGVPVGVWNSGFNLCRLSERAQRRNQ